ncbi:MAG: hypothetical protein L0H79_10320 [Intrasporangium sp.]|uniref:hypothetical protein n=1 Tax=Intrasporangium sp. TaxID=1925024 RepID=UPI0026478AFB|nr:hypothetical protein [Intrasporangium sp.]MDN5796131.1 hypothetical protein [Intrasporangium sp.]
MTQTTTERLPTVLTVRVVGWWLAVVVVCAAAWVLCFVVPYYVNDLDEPLPPDYSGPFYDPDGLWPSTVNPAGVFGFLWNVLWAAASMVAFSFHPSSRC